MGLYGLYYLVVRGEGVSKLGIILCLLPVVLFVLIVGFAIWDQQDEDHFDFPCWIDGDCSE